MRLFVQAVSIEERRAVAPPSLPRLALPRIGRRTTVAAAGMAAGALLWILYLYLMIHSTTPWFYAVFGLVGAACGLALVTIPALMWDFVRKQGYQVLLRQWTDKSRVLATAARRELREQEGPFDPQAENDMAVVDFLQGNHPQAVAGFEHASVEGAGEAYINLLPALAESGRWDQLLTHVHGDLRLDAVANEPNLARLSARLPDNSLLQRLWGFAEERRHALLLNNLAARAMRAGQYAQAARALELAADIRPGYAYAHANRAVLAYRQGKLGPAVSEAASAAGLVAEDDIVFSNLGALLALAGDLRGAERWLEKAHRLQPRSAEALINLANAYSQSGRADEAAVSYHAALHTPSRVADAEYNLGLHLYHLGHLPEAVEHFNKALAANPDDPDCLNNVGCVLFRQGQHGQAHEAFARVAEIGGGAFRRNVVRSELAAGRQAEATTILEQASDTDGLNLERGLLYLLRALDIKPETTTHRQMLEFNLSAAVTAFTKAMAEGNGTAAEAQLNYGLAQYLRGEHVAAAETFAQALRKGTPHTEMTYLAGMCYVMAGLRDYEQHEVRSEELPPSARELFLKARPLLEKASEIQGVAESAAYDLGLLNYLLGDHHRAIDVLRRIVRTDSPSYVLNTLAVAQARLAQELQLSAQTASLMSETRKRDIRAQARQLLAGAVHYFKQVLTIEPEAALTHGNMGLALMLRNQKGDVEAALQHWQLMHQHGGSRHRETYEQFMQVMSADGAQKLRFQDVELTFHPVNIRAWVVFPQPKLSGFRYVVQELLDEPDWQLQAHHRLVRKALAYRLKAERVRRKLRRLAI